MTPDAVERVPYKWWLRWLADRHMQALAQQYEKDQALTLEIQELYELYQGNL